MSVPAIRIFSDLHHRDSESRVQQLDDLRPLFAGAGRVILNGDTLDTRSERARDDLAAVREWFSRNAPETTFLSGNHDPDISATGELSLLDGRVWITHGDVLFDDIAPWCAERDEVAQAVGEVLREFPAETHHLIETRLRVNRLACLRLPDHHDRTNRHPLHRMARMARTLFPPARILAMLDAWRTTPERARRLAAAQRPAARLAVLGHTHRPGVWRLPDGFTVVNTGCFSPPFGARFVELDRERVSVVRIERRGRAFHPGKVVAAFPLAP